MARFYSLLILIMKSYPRKSDMPVALRMRVWSGGTRAARPEIADIPERLERAKRALKDFRCLVFPTSAPSGFPSTGYSNFNTLVLEHLQKSGHQVVRWGRTPNRASGVCRLSCQVK
jgi:hypothetical protein